MVSLRPLKDPTLLISKFAAVIPEHWSCTNVAGVRCHMSDHEHIDRIWAIIEKVGVCMLTTRFDVGMRARPLEARPDRASNRLLFMTDAHSPKREEMVRWPEVCLTFIDTAAKAYLLSQRHSADCGQRRSAACHHVAQERCGVVARRPKRSQRLCPRGRASNSRTLGWTFQQRGRGLRVCQGAGNGN
jgi:Pyridoxamine 5'-phosphate oxidase like